jgi:hypothetical protein
MAVTKRHSVTGGLANLRLLNTGILDESVERPREQELGSDAVVRSNFVRRDALVSA